LLTFYDGHADPVSALGWSPDGQYIASGSWDHTVQVWYAHTGETISIYRGHSEFVDAVAWSPNGQYIASGDRNNTVLVWNALTGKTLNYFTEEYTGGIIEALAWSPDGRFIASGSRDKTIRVWEAFTGKLFLTYKGHTDEVSALACLPTAGILPRVVGIIPCKYGWPPLPGNDLSWLLSHRTLHKI
jgi:WD40 repeat protein